MSLRLFEGPAGSGKTTALFEQLARELVDRPLGDHERVLALTKMHGSRRRMQSRLTTLPGLSRRFECSTVDSFAWRLLRRWRSLARVRGTIDLGETDYEKVCRCAGALLTELPVRSWTARRFPIVVVDELQDSKGGQLEMIRALSESATCLAAADHFQDLDSSEGNNAAVVWARRSGAIVSLNHNHRTSAAGLLAAARAIREGKAVPAKGERFVVLGARNENIGASYVSRNLSWWKGCDDIAVITPVGTQSSPFVRNLVARVERASIGTPAFGPHRIPWEISQEDECGQFLSLLRLPEDPSAEVRASDFRLPDQSGLSKALRAWLDRHRRLAGRTTFTVREIRHQVEAIGQRTRAYRRARDRGVRLMTIHQAKNREFESVIVLWPYQVAGSPERQRRLLYNAITRAKRQVAVIVQNRQRLNQPPFAATTAILQAE